MCNSPSLSLWLDYLYSFSSCNQATLPPPPISPTSENQDPRVSWESRGATLITMRPMDAYCSQNVTGSTWNGTSINASFTKREKPNSKTQTFYQGMTKHTIPPVNCLGTESRIFIYKGFPTDLQTYSRTNTVSFKWTPGSCSVLLAWRSCFILWPSPKKSAQLTCYSL